MIIEIVNIYKRKPDFYCGRGSALGNPFRMENESMRDKVCEQFEKYFNEQVFEKHNQGMLRQLHAIKEFLRINGSVKLGCFCAPKRCHCETIEKHLLEVFQEKQADNTALPIME